MPPLGRESLSDVPLIRSWLEVPADTPERVAGALREPADAVILDLTAPPSVEDGRQALLALTDLTSNPKGPLVFVGIHHPASGLAREDLQAAVRPGVTGIRVPAVDNPESLWRIQNWLVEAELNVGVAPNSLRLVGAIGSAAGLWRAVDIGKANPRVLALTLDHAALREDLGTDGESSDDDLLYARTQLVLACRVAGLRPPVDGTPLARSSLAAVEQSTARARGLGLFGRVVTDPRHLAVVDAVYAPTSGEISSARRQTASEDGGLAGRARALLALVERLGIGAEG
jgi:citrate lyase subunit beta/citryl-CoA lyase